MTKTPEELYQIEERYLILADYDMAKAELLRLLDQREWCTDSLDSMQANIRVPSSVATLHRKLLMLVDEGLVEADKDSRPYKYRVDPEEFPRRVNVLGLKLLPGAKKVFSQGEKSSFHDVKSDPDISLPEKSEQGNSDKVSEKKPRKPRKKAKNVDKVSESDKMSEANNKEVISVTTSDTMSDTLDDPVGDTLNADTNDTLNADTNDTLNAETTSDYTLQELAPGLKNRFYDWQHYAQFSEKEWELARTKGELPGKERYGTLIIGAYLLGMKKLHDEDIGLVPGDFNGKYGALSRQMLHFFTDKNGGDRLKGFNDALDWIREFLKAGADSYPGKAGWPIQMAFNRDMYRQAGLGRFKGGTGKKRNDTGTVIMTQEDRAKALEGVQIGG